MRVKIIRNYEQYKIGQTVDVTEARAKLLIKSGAAIKTKDITSLDLKVK